MKARNLGSIKYRFDDLKRGVGHSHIKSQFKRLAAKYSRNLIKKDTLKQVKEE